MEEKKMKRRNDEREFFEVNCKTESQELSLQIPERLYNDFENSLNDSVGIQNVTNLFESFAVLTQEQQEFFQMLIYRHADKVLGVVDLGAMLRAMLKVWEEE